MIGSGLLAIAAITGLGWLLALGAALMGGQWSAGSYLAYNVWLGRSQEIRLLDVDSALTVSLARRLEPGLPVWSPDGRYLAFEARHNGGSSIFVMEVFGGRPRLLTPHHAGNQYTPVWFHDGSGLYFRNVPGEGALAYSVNLDGEHLQPIEVINYEYLIPRRFDPTRPLVIAYANGLGGIFVAKDNLSRLEHLVTTDVVFREQPQWSPDSQQIAFVSWGNTSNEIYVMNADGSQFRRATTDGRFKSNLSWRP